MVLLLLWLNWYLSFCLKSGTREKENISLCFGFFRYCSYYNSQVTRFFHLLSHITIFFSFFCLTENVMFISLQKSRFILILDFDIISILDVSDFH